MTFCRVSEITCDGDVAFGSGCSEGETYYGTCAEVFGRLRRLGWRKVRGVGHLCPSCVALRKKQQQKERRDDG